MPFRERLKRAFRSGSTSSDLRKSSTQKSEQSAQHDPNMLWPSNVYKPGEPMPRPKYRAPVKPEHKEKLDSFSWGNAWRRRSFMSEYSPMGSRMPSRRGSMKSFGGRSSRGNSRRNSLGDSAVDGLQTQTKSRHAARATRLSAEIEAEGDDDVTNVGLSRVQSRDKDKALSRQLSAANEPMPTAGARGDTVNGTVPNTIDGVAHDHQPFTEEELVLAMKRSHLTVPKDH